VARRKNARIRRHAFELRPGGATVDARKRAMIEARWPEMRARAEGLGLAIAREHPPLGVDTRPAHVAAQAAAALAPERAGDFHDAVFRAHWVEREPIGDRARLVELGAGVGLDPETFRAALDDERHLRAVLADEDEARAHGIGGVPQVVMNGYLLPAGMLPEEALREAAEEVARRPPRPW
jgi:predicted DsbA family dithiol-disulfide isomerase